MIEANVSDSDVSSNTTRPHVQPSNELLFVTGHCVVASTFDSFLRRVFYLSVLMRDPGAKIRSAGSTHYPFANFVRISDRMIFALIRRPGSGVSDASDVAFGGRTDMPVCTAHVCF